ncbi:hypothetical protein [Hydrogenobaculum acidophilum]
MKKVRLNDEKIKAIKDSIKAYDKFLNITNGILAIDDNLFFVIANGDRLVA